MDDNVWTGKPNIVNSIDDCKTEYCYIWNKDITPIIPTITRNDGRIQGPASGVVIQFERCRIDSSNNLLSGRIAVGYNSGDEGFGNFVNNVWKILRNFACNGVFYKPQYGPVDMSRIIKEFSVGDTAKSAVYSKKISSLKHRSTENYYYPM